MPVGALPRAELVPDTFVAMSWVIRWKVPHRRPPQVGPLQLLVVVVLLGVQVEPQSSFCKVNSMEAGSLMIFSSSFTAVVPWDFSRKPASGNYVYGGKRGYHGEV